MGSIRRRATPPGPVTELFDRLNELHLQAGEPSVRQIAAAIGRGVVSSSSIYNTFSGPRVPAWGFLQLIVEQLGGSTADFQALWYAARRAERNVVGDFEQALSEAPAPAASPPAKDAFRGPSVWGALPPRNPHFTARHMELETLHERFSQTGTGGQAPVTQVLCGHGGVGKTEIAVEYAYRHRAEYSIVWWVRAEQEHLVRSTLIELGDHLQLHDVRGSDSDRLIEKVMEALHHGIPYERSLLIFDNALRPDALSRYLPEGRAHVIITTQSLAWRRALPASTHNIQEFEFAEAIEFLRRRVARLGSAPIVSYGGNAAERETVDALEEQQRLEAATQLATLLDGLPLAVEHAAAYLNETDVSVTVFTQRYRQHASEIQNPDADYFYPGAVATCWSMSEAILSRAAVALFYLVAKFSAEPIAEELLVQPTVAEQLPPDLRDVLSDTRQFRRAVRELARFSLVRFDAVRNETQMHRIVRAVAERSLAQDGPTRESGYRRAVHMLLAGTDPEAPERSENDAAYERSRHHLIPSGAINSDFPPARMLVINQVRYMHLRGRYSEAFALALTAFKRWRQSLGDSHIHTLALATELGVTERLLGQNERALERIADTMRLLERHYGRENEAFLNCARHYSSGLRALGKYREAFERDQQLLPISRELVGDADFQTLSLLNNIAIGLRCLGRFEEALDYDIRTYAEKVAILGPADRIALDSQFAMARDLRRLGRYEDSLDELTKIIKIVEKVGEPWRLPTLLYSLDLGITLRRLGYYNEALNQCEAILQRHIELVGAGHRQSLQVAINLINDRRITDDLRGACDLGISTIDRLRDVVGEGHPNTYAAMANLAAALRRSGRPDTARDMNTAALDGLTTVFGETHPHCLTVMCNLASDLAASGSVDEAVQIGERALAASRRVRGESHPFSLATAANLALDYWTIGRHEQASPLHDRTVRQYHEQLSPYHPEFRTVSQRVRVDLDIEPDHD